MRKCAVSSCDTKALDRGFYKVPDSNPVRKKAWTDACGIKSDESAAKLICWKHFKSDQFKKEISVDRGIFGRLKKNATPTEFLPGPPITVNLEAADFNLGSETVIEIPTKKTKSPLKFFLYNSFFH